MISPKKKICFQLHHLRKASLEIISLHHDVSNLLLQCLQLPTLNGSIAKMPCKSQEREKHCSTKALTDKLQCLLTQQQRSNTCYLQPFYNFKILNIQKSQHVTLACSKLTSTLTTYARYFHCPTRMFATERSTLLAAAVIFLAACA